MPDKKTDIMKVDLNVVDVDVVQPDKVITRIMKSQGLSKVPSTAVKDLKRLGIHLGGIGILKTTHGEMFLNQQRMGQVMRVLVDKIMNPQDRITEKVVDGDTEVEVSNEMSPAEESALIGKVVAMLGGKLTDAHKLMLESAGVRFKRGRDVEVPQPPTRQSFAPGQNVQPPVNVQIINNGANPEVKVNGEKVVAPQPAPS